MNKILEIQGLTKYFGEQRILENLAFSLEEPKIIALVAPNGTGKTTLLNIIANIDVAESGTIQVLGQPNTNYQMFYDLSYLQDPSILYEQLTGWDHLEFVRKEQKKSKEELNELVNELGIESYLKKKVKNYSLGMKQNLLLALSLVPKPKLLLMDEPLNGLDPDSIIKVRNIMRTLNQRGVSMIISSHNLDEIEKVTEDVYFLHDGKLVEKDEVTIEAIEYIIVLKEIEKAMSFLSRINVTCRQLSEYKLQGRFTQQQMNVFHSFCEEQELTLFDCQPASGQLEKIYFNLFMKKQETQP
ncbi:hypothetical protein UAW_02986 [Enterococcus haemoperoxidus ATCC BAA-382]|uniref:ABC transporter domain-containing protein n=1 Tax=Enterococcus haemoperoxidus ATCC BAA-382 TaxID=1158608 RepID=R2SX08_9ENTE|nr:ABC transporter ATP-binding protein [Enterococcus haemoperoxidus]EOH92589.1 hypothetical protein UAW_02986 [Enterococcus haemoperoxidus ATCC BAA-382]EOT61688.1 hypothetical protein I583_00670 [Enterococcus haemoperoxidus ATCC BAA-382]OJG55524.1 hypothetical protein RV06_GL001967 [Enterococcus haemoperoxidus]